MTHLTQGASRKNKEGGGFWDSGLGETHGGRKQKRKSGRAFVIEILSIYFLFLFMWICYGISVSFVCVF